MILWVPVIALARRTPTRRSPRVALVVVAVLALATQAALAQGHVAGTVSAATTGQVCQFPRKTVGISGDLYPAPRGTTLDLCVQGRPGGGYLGDGWDPSCQHVHGRCEYPDPARGR